MKWRWKKFDELSLQELYDLLRLRQEVFVVGQGCAYLDADGLDQKSHHLLGYLDNDLVAYLRVMPPGLRFKETAIGRVAVGPKHRGKGFGKDLTEEALKRITAMKTKPVRISAQKYLEKFYGDFGFKTVSKDYLEDNIPHVEMFLE